jgi:hypothetical protein
LLRGVERPGIELAVSSIRDRTIKTLGNFQHNRSPVARAFGKWSHQNNQIAPSLLNFRHASMDAIARGAWHNPDMPVTIRSQASLT